MKRVELFLSSGDIDYLGNIWHENRYIVLEDGMDTFGEHMSLDEVTEVIRECHSLTTEVGTYSDYKTAVEIRDINNLFFERTSQHYILVAVVCPFEGSEVCSVKVYRL